MFYVDDILLDNGWKIGQRIQHRNLRDRAEIEEVDVPEDNINECFVEDVK